MSTQPIEGFDPYRAWLNVKEVHRPLNAYQLLRLEAFESDVQTIRAAAGLQRMAIQTHRHEAPAAVWDQVYRELEDAIGILLDPDKKAAYDVALQTREEANIHTHDTAVAVTGRDQGGSVQCPKCSWLNLAMRKFCANCGAHLWEPCFECGSLSLASDRYCGACGANLVSGVQNRIREFEASLAEAVRLRRDSRYDDAIALLESMTRVEHSSLRPYRDQSRELIAAITAERDGSQVKAEEAIDHAQESLSNHDYQAAVHLLESVAPALRTTEMKRVLEEARSKLREAAALDDELGSVTASQQTLSVLPRVGRLLVLKPDHGRARQLADRFKEHAFRVAEGKLAAHQYLAAVKLLDQLPEPVRTSEVESLRQRAAELAWLMGDLRHAPVVDQALVRIGERLRELVPDDPRVAKIVAEVRRRAENAVSDPRRGLPPWAAPPEETRLGYPVDQLAGLQRIGIKEDLVGPFLLEHPGSLLVACGLALQGLGQVRVRLNLFPRESVTALGRIAGLLQEDALAWMSGKRAARSAWGLDLSASGLKAVRLVRQSEEPRVILRALDVVAHRKPLAEAFSEEEASAILEETLGTFRLRNNTKNDRICLGLPGRMSLARGFTMPALDAAKREKAIAYEARRHIPIPLEEVVWDYHLMGRSDDNGAPRRKDEVLLVAARRPQLLERLAALRKAGLRIDMVQSDCLALHNLLAYDHFGDDGSEEPLPSDEDRYVALLDVGSDQTHLVVSSPTFVWFRSTGFGAEQFTRALVRDLKLTSSEAEELKRHPTRSESIHRTYEALEPPMESLLGAAQSLLSTFTRGHDGRRIERVLGCGGGFQLHGLLRCLRSGL
jgi:type IV pilus assembly protein PilM